MNKVELSGAIILDKQNKILLIHRNTKELKQWELPGGKLELGELPELVELKFNNMKYFSKKELESNQELSSNMKVMISNIDIEAL